MRFSAHTGDTWLWYNSGVFRAADASFSFIPCLGTELSLQEDLVDLFEENKHRALAHWLRQPAGAENWLAPVLTASSEKLHSELCCPVQS